MTAWRKSPIKAIPLFEVTNLRMEKVVAALDSESSVSETHHRFARLYGLHRVGITPAMSASETAAKFLHEFYETYFQPLEKPLGRGKRFIYALSGAFSLFISGFILLVFKIPDIFQNTVFEITPFSTLYYLMAILLLSVFFAYLVSWAETRHGPVRLYLSGVLLPALVIYIIRVAWTFEKVAPAANQQ